MRGLMLHQKRAWWLTGALWLFSQLVAFVALGGDYLPTRAWMLVINGLSCVAWYFAMKGMARDDRGLRAFHGWHLPLWFDSLLSLVLPFAAESQDLFFLASAIKVLLWFYLLAGIVMLGARLAVLGGLETTASLRGAALHAHLQSIGYSSLSLEQSVALWKDCGETGFLLPPWEDCATLPGVKEGDLESLARVARLNREARGKRR